MIVYERGVLNMMAKLMLREDEIILDINGFEISSFRPLPLQRIDNIDIVEGRCICFNTNYGLEIINYNEIIKYTAERLKINHVELLEMFDNIDRFEVVQ